MTQHRFRELIQQPVCWERVRPTAFSANGFMVCPLVVQEWLACQSCQWDLYQRAWQQALDLARPSVLDRYETALWN